MSYPWKGVVYRAIFLSIGVLEKWPALVRLAGAHSGISHVLEWIDKWFLTLVVGLGQGVLEKQ